MATIATRALFPAERQATTQAENMTKEEFASYQKQNVDHETQKFIEAMRHAILSQNDNGEFMTHGISPAALTDDWVLRATQFLREICTQPQLWKTSALRLAMTKKCKPTFSEGWLVVKAFGKPLPLAMFFTKHWQREQEEIKLQGVLDRISAHVHLVISQTFPFCTVAPLEKAQLLWKQAAEEEKCSEGDIAGRDVKEALDRIQALRDGGASNTQIKMEMQHLKNVRKAHIRTTRKHTFKTKMADNNIKNETKTKHEKDLEKQDSVEDEGRNGALSKVKKRSYTDAFMVSKQNYRTMIGSRSVWKVVLVGLALYYVYWHMRTAPAFS